MSFYSFTVGVVLFAVVPIIYWIKCRRDVFLLAYGIFGLPTLNTTLMAVIRDCGGMGFLEKIGKHPWFAAQYEVSYWCWLASGTALVLFFLRLIGREKRSHKRKESL